MEYPDSLSRYCKRLGHPVPFKYCRLTVGDSPCYSIFSCWGQNEDARSAAEFLARSLDYAPRPDKRVQLFDLIKKAKENQTSST